ncbi:hypothetical protein Emag_001244 [Eimeria magna]
MELFEAFGSAPVPARSLLDFTPLSAPQKKHVSHIYAALAANVLITALGVYVQLNLFSLPSFLCMLLSFGCVLGLTFSSQKAHAESKVRGSTAVGVYEQQQPTRIIFSNNPLAVNSVGGLK